MGHEVDNKFIDYVSAGKLEHCLVFSSALVVALVALRVRGENITMLFMDRVDLTLPCDISVQSLRRNLDLLKWEN